MKLVNFTSKPIFKGYVCPKGNTVFFTLWKNGVVTTVAAGSAVITVTTKDGGKTADCYVTVNDPTGDPVNNPTNPGGGGLYLWELDAGIWKHYPRNHNAERGQIARRENHLLQRQYRAPCGGRLVHRNL